MENDISGLRGILGELNLCKSDLEAHVESLKDDLLCLKQSHEEVSEGGHYRNKDYGNSSTERSCVSKLNRADTA